MKTLKGILQGFFYSFVFAQLLSRALTNGISHDENQFIAAGQLLAYHGLLPYRDYPYTHMPYAVPLYAASAWLSPYDYLAARILGALVWLACIGLIVAISRLIVRKQLEAGPTFAALLGEFAIVFIFLYHPISDYVLESALNHSFATLLSLLSLLFFLRALQGSPSLRRDALLSGVFISLAAFTRFNFASLAVILMAMWILYAFTAQPTQRLTSLKPFVLGLLIPALPVLALLLPDPAAFYYGNIVYIRLNTLYYQGILFRQNMDLASKTASFMGSLLHSPIDLALYVMLILVGIASLVRFVRSRSLAALFGLCAAGFAGTIFLTAFTPTPTQWHYFFAPLPFMLVLLAMFAWEVYQRNRAAYVALFCGLLVALLATVRIPDPVTQLSELTRPADWKPLQVHDFAESLTSYLPGGRILTLMPMIPLEAGYDVYSFTAAGPFPWRTSLLLSSARRAAYGVTSPVELPALLDASPPDGILTGFETPNAGFTLGDLGGLERPFNDYASQHGYNPITLSPKFLEHSLILWVRQLP